MAFARCTTLVVMFFWLLPFAHSIANAANQIQIGKKAAANNPDTDNTKATPIAHHLADSPTWTRLLHLRKINGNWQSDIKSADFYLSNTIHPNPAIELTATLSAFYDPASQGNNHAICKFPARYHWLSSIIPELANTPKPDCSGLTSWLDPIKDKPIHVVHVSGYFGNPASAFGHLLMRIGQAGDQDFRGLLSLGINFGAKIPPDESATKYIFKGLLGGYSASFTDKKHYLQDHVYSAVEARDMWGFQLALKPTQKQLLLTHLWELRRVPFSYYFLRTNCAYRIAELLELSLNQPFIKPSSLYYLPVDVFYQLDKLNQTHFDGQLIEKIEFIPSKKREVTNALNSLPTQQKELVQKLLAQNTIAPFKASLTTPVVDFLNDYVDLQITDTRHEDFNRLSQLKDELLLYRLTNDAIPFEPDTDTPTLLIQINNPTHRSDDPSLQAPGLGPRARVIELAFSEDKNNNRWSSFRIAPYAFDLLDTNRGSLIDSSFRVLDLTIDNRDNEPRVRQIDLIGFEKLSPPSSLAKLSKRNQYAWRGALTYRRAPQCESGCSIPEISASIGKSTSTADTLLAGFIDSSIDLKSLHLTTGLSITAIWTPTAQLRAHWQSQIYTASGTSGTDVTHELSLRLRPHRDHALQLTLSNETRLQLKYNLRW